MRKSVKKKSLKKSQNKNSFFLGFDEVKNYLKESRRYVYVIIGLFLLFTLVGFFVPLPQEIKNQLIQYFDALVNRTKGFGPLEMILYLFQNNVFASFLGLLGGVLFGVFPFINGIMNGFVLGFAANLSVINNGVFSLWRLFPHGIFELPALFISLGLGVRLGGKFLEKYFEVKGEVMQSLIILVITLPLILLVGVVYSFSLNSVNLAFFVLIVLLSFYFLRDEGLRKELKFSLNVFLYVVIPLLAIAAIIEGLFITL